MTFTTIEYRCIDVTARITLNRPDRMNCFTQIMHEELRAALALVQSDGARVLVITGAGRGFCAGQDLNDRAVAPGQAHRNRDDGLDVVSSHGLSYGVDCFPSSHSGIP